MSVSDSHFFVSALKRKNQATPQGGVISTRESSELPANQKPELSWSNDQQKALEKALTIVSKTTDDRWTVIATHVPGKTKVSSHSILGHYLSSRSILWHCLVTT